MVLDTSPFFFPGGDVGCLLIHGFSNTPHEMREMGEYLAERGVTALGVRLAGHGTSPEEMARTGWRDWVASAEEGLRRLLGCSSLFVAGISAGGLIALYLGLRHTCDGIIAMSVPVYLKDWQVRFLPIMRHLSPWYRESRCDLTDPQAWFRYYAPPASYERKPLVCASSLMELQRIVRGRLAEIDAPVLLMYGEKDLTMPLGNARYIFEHIGSREKGLLWFKNSGHGLVVDSEKREVWARAYEFMLAHSGREYGEVQG